MFFSTSRTRRTTNLHLWQTVLSCRQYIEPSPAALLVGAVRNRPNPSLLLLRFVWMWTYSSKICGVLEVVASCSSDRIMIIKKADAFGNAVTIVFFVMAIISKVKTNVNAIAMIV